MQLLTGQRTRADTRCCMEPASKRNVAKNTTPSKAISCIRVQYRVQIVAATENWPRVRKKRRHSPPRVIVSLRWRAARGAVQKELCGGQGCMRDVQTQGCMGCGEITWRAGPPSGLDRVLRPIPLRLLLAILLTHVWRRWHSGVPLQDVRCQNGAHRPSPSLWKLCAFVTTPHSLARWSCHSSPD